MSLVISIILTISYLGLNSWDCVEERNIDRIDSLSSTDLGKHGDTRPVVIADTYLEVYSNPWAYHKDPFYVYGTLYERGEHLDVGSPNGIIHIYWGEDRSDEEFITLTQNEGNWRIPISVNQTPDDYPLFIEFRGEVLINGTYHEFDEGNMNHTVDNDQDGKPDHMTRFPSNISLDVEVFYHSSIEAEISSTQIDAGDSFWLNGTATVNETGGPLTHAILNVTQNDKYIDRIEITPDDDGEFSKRIRFSNATPPGPHDLKVDYWQFYYPENRQYGSSYSDFTVHFNQRVLIDFSVTHLLTGGMVYFNGTITDLRGERLYDPTDHAKVFYIDGELVNGTEDEKHSIGETAIINGTFFNTSFILPDDFPAGQAVINLYFQRTALYTNGSTGSDVTVVTKPSIKIDPFSFNSQVENVSGSVKDRGGRGLSVPVIATINNIQAGNGVSNEHGDYFFPVSLPEDIGIGYVEIVINASETSFSLSAKNRIEAYVYKSAVLRCDLAVSSDGITIDYALPGDGSGLLNVSFLVINEGNVPSEPTQVRVLSLPDLDSMIYLEEIEPKGSVIIEFKWLVKDNITLAIFVNPDGILDEIYYNNNEAIVSSLNRKYYDLDGDGENNHFDNDTDGDHYTDIEETEAGSDPYDRNSKPDEKEDPVREPKNTKDSESHIWLYIILLIFVFVIIGVAVLLKGRRDKT